MFKKVDKSLFDGLTQELDPVKRFKVEYPKDYDDFAQKVWKDVIAYCKFGKRNEAYKVMFLDGDTLERKWFFMSPKQFDYLKRWNTHCEERLKKGASFRDAWDIHWWLANSIPEALKSLRESLHGYPTCAIDLWNKLAEITGDQKIDEAAVSEALAVKGQKVSPETAKKLIVGPAFMSTEDEPGGIDDFRFKLWEKSLERLEFLFREYNDDTCTMKNPYKFEWHYDWVPVEGDKNGLVQMTWSGTNDEKTEHDKYMDRAFEIDRYKSECLHKALKILEIFIEYLWD